MSRYSVVIQGRQRELPEEWVLPWVHGVADSHNAAAALDALDPKAPEETNRMHALQIGHQSGWFEYLYVRRGDT